MNPYAIPFDDNTFHVVTSNQVSEYVEDYESAIRETYRVLKPRGMSSHLFPSRWSQIEVHLYLPLVGAWRNQCLLRAWA